MEDPTAGQPRCLRTGDDWPEFGRMVPAAHLGLSIVTRKPAGVAMGDGSNFSLFSGRRGASRGHHVRCEIMLSPPLVSRDSRGTKFGSVFFLDVF